MSARVGGIVERLQGLHPRLIDLDLGRLEILLAKLDHPERRLPPVVHVAGTNGKGSTCAFLRAFAEAAGMRVHVYTSPHLVRFNERIRLAGEIVSDEVLIEALEHVERVNAGAPITVFEVITAAALHLFSTIAAELCVLEVGLGGRGDATNVVPRPASCAITSISLDHQDLLGDALETIAAEKAGIMKPGVPVVIGAQPPSVREILLQHAEAVGAPALLRDRDWRIGERGFADGQFSVGLPRLSLPGLHQRDNAGIAVAALRAAGLGVGADAFRDGAARAEWPARLQPLHGRLASLLPADWELWLDGGHNVGAARVLADHVAQWSDRPLHLVVGMKRSKDCAAFLAPLLPHATTLWAVAEPDQHAALDPDAIVEASGGMARRGPTVGAALGEIARAGAPGRVLICGSLYLAGEVLKADGP